MLTVVETPVFQRLAADVWDAAEREEFITFISAHPLVGDVVAGTQGIRKVRWSRPGMGKRGGARVIYFNRLACGDLVLLMVYTKAKLDNVRPEFLLKLKEQLDV